MNSFEKYISDRYGPSLLKHNSGYGYSDLEDAYKAGMIRAIACTFSEIAADAEDHWPREIREEAESIN